MNLVPVIDLLRQRAGLDPGSMGAAALDGAVAGRLRALGLSDVNAYLDRLRRDAGEMQALLDEVVVPETWFFRGGDLFAWLAGRVRAAGRGRAAPFRALSLPCSSGEEPYSLAIALAEVGLPASAYRIDGIDISPRSIEQARRGVFPELSFRQTDPALRGRYFRAVAGGWEIVPSLRESVRFEVGNLLDPGLLVLSGVRGQESGVRSQGSGAAASSLTPDSCLLTPGYDLVFCRNLFIYLTTAARRQALATLLRLMAPDGLLCLGHAEPLPADEDRFERTGPEQLFLYRRRKQLQEEKKPAPVSTTAFVHPSSFVLRPSNEEERHLLARARREADAGQLDQALESCRQGEARFGPSAEAYCLMGLVHQARQDRAAARASFRKALYLDPDHREALVHLMLLYQLQGEHAQAALLRRRLERLAPESGGES
jgi:chemotaxis protein methyltransferase WspC